MYKPEVGEWINLEIEGMLSFSKVYDVQRSSFHMHGNPAPMTFDQIIGPRLARGEACQVLWGTGGWADAEFICYEYNICAKRWFAKVIHEPHNCPSNYSQIRRTPKEPEMLASNKVSANKQVVSICPGCAVSNFSHHPIYEQLPDTVKQECCVCGIVYLNELTKPSQH